MYDEPTAAFNDVYGPENKKSKALTFTVGAPVILKEVPVQMGKKILQQHFLNKEEFCLQYPFCSVANHQPSFNPRECRFLWRGATWVIINCMLYKCLIAKGFHDEAEKISITVKKLIVMCGFPEYYNPFTGKGVGQKILPGVGYLLI